MHKDSLYEKNVADTLFCLLSFNRKKNLNVFAKKDNHIFTLDYFHDLFIINKMITFSFILVIKFRTESN